jgi:signal peptidase I
MVKFTKKFSSSRSLSFEEKKKAFSEVSQGAVSKLKSKFSFLRWLDPFTYVDLFVMPHVKRVSKRESVELLVNVVFALLFAWIIYSLLGFLFGTSSPLVIVYSASMEPTFFRGDVMALSRASSPSFFSEPVILDRKISKVPTIDFVSPNYFGSKLVSFSFKRADGSTFEVFPNLNGQVVVYPAFNPSDSHMNTNGKPIIHRAIVFIEALDGNFVLTKGDNNPYFDQDCGRINSFDVSEKHCISLYAVPLNELKGKTFFMVPKVGCVKLWLMDDLLSLIVIGKLPQDFKGVC